MEQEYLKTQNPVSLVIKSSIPMVISMLVNSLYNIIDSLFIARISGEAMTAISLVFPLQNIITSIAVGIGIGINAAAAYFMGAGRKKVAEETSLQGLIMNIVHGLILMVLGVTFAPIFVRMFTTNPDTIAYAVQYSQTVFLFSIIVMAGITFEKIFQAIGKMSMSMIGMLAGSIVNIILDPILIFGMFGMPKMGIRGAALATGIAQTVTLLVYLAFYFWGNVSFHMFNKQNIGTFQHLKRIYAVGIPGTLNMALPSILITALNTILTSYADGYVLILGIYYKLQTFIYLTVNGIVQGIRPLISFNFGAGQMLRVKKIYRIALVMSAVIMFGGMCGCVFFGHTLVGLFTTDAWVIEHGSRAFLIISMGFLPSTISVITSGSMEALGKGGASLIISCMRYIVIIGVAYLLSLFLGVTGVWHAFWVTELVTAVMAWMGLSRISKM